jgi:hypothetical protein
VAKRRRSRGKTALKISKYHVGLALSLLGAIFFFSKIAAPDAPIFSFLSNYASIAFGQIGLGVFFALCIVIGLLIVCKGHLMKTLMKQFVLLMFVVSGILNFAVMQEGLTNTIINWKASSAYGGYFSRPLIKGLELVFGDSILAIKIIIVVLALALLAWMFYTLNVKLPSLPKINVERYEKPEKKADTSAGAKPFITKESKITSDSELLKKVSQAAGTAFGHSAV